VDPYAESNEWGFTRQELTDFYPVALNSDYLPELQGRYGWPIFKDMQVLHYNEDWLIELGYDSPPETLEAFEEITCAAPKQSFSDSKGEGSSWGFAYPARASQFASFLFGMGGDITNKAGTEFVFDDEEGLATLVFLRLLATHDCATLTDDTATRIGDFGEGRTLFLIASVHQLADTWAAVDQGAGFGWSVSPVPHSTDQPRMNVFGPSLSILKTAPENQLAAWLFTRWLSEPTQQAKWAASTGYLPTRRSSAELLTDYLATHPNYAKALGYLANRYGTQLPISGYSQCQTFIGGMLTAVAAGGDIRGELDATVEQCTRLLH
jgi:multiple sugar transport system substrate-binding protein